MGPPHARPLRRPSASRPLRLYNPSFDNKLRPPTGYKPTSGLLGPIPFVPFAGDLCSSPGGSSLRRAGPPCGRRSAVPASSGTRLLCSREALHPRVVLEPPPLSADSRPREATRARERARPPFWPHSNPFSHSGLLPLSLPPPPLVGAAIGLFLSTVSSTFCIIPPTRGVHRCVCVERKPTPPPSVLRQPLFCTVSIFP